MDSPLKLQKLRLKRRATAIVIGHLLLIAITVVGGIVVFVFAQGWHAGAQISGNPTIESLEIIGYDARDAKQLKLHDLNDITPKNSGGSPDSVKRDDERVTIFLKNNSVQPISINELRFGGSSYNYTTTDKIGNWNGVSDPQPGHYIIMTGADGENSENILQESAPMIQSGETLTILLDLDKSYPIGRDSQVLVISDNGMLFSLSVVIGQGTW